MKDANGLADADCGFNPPEAIFIAARGRAHAGRCRSSGSSRLKRAGATSGGVVLAAAWRKRAHAIPEPASAYFDSCVFRNSIVLRIDESCSIMLSTALQA